MNKFKYYISKSWPLLALSVLAVLGFYYNFNRNVEFDTKIESAERELSNAVSELSLSKKRVDNYRNSRDEIQKFTKKMFPKGDPQRIIDNIREEASAHNIYLEDIEIDIPKFMTAREKLEMITFMKFKAVFSGGYYSLGKFILMLEESPYLEKIDETNIMPIPGGGQRVRVTIKGALRVFDNNLLEWCEIDGT